MKPCPHCQKKDTEIRILKEKVEKERVAREVYVKDNKRLREERE